MFIRRCLRVAVLSVGSSRLASAQTVRGVVVDAAVRPVAGVVLLLLDSGAQVAARGLSDQNGRFRVATSRSGRYRLRTLRIGFRPTLSDPIDLRLGGEIEQRVTLSNLPMLLDTVRVAERNVCRAFTDSGAATFAVWDQVRTALLATQLTSASRTVAATTLAYSRVLDAGPGRTAGNVLRQQSSVSTDYVTKPWRTLPPDSLRRVGYIVTDRDDALIYYAPDIETLLSPGFVEDHCFRLVTDRKRSGMVGVSFEPTPDRKRVVEIRGTMWVDRASSELRTLEFRYVNAMREQEDQAGATLEFVRMRDGAWSISRWDIRMPVFQQVVGSGREAQAKLAAIQVAGGELVLARRGQDTLWHSAPLSLSGVVLDSSTKAALAHARVGLSGTGLDTVADDRGRFTINGVLPGQYTVEVRTPALDSLHAIHQSSITFASGATPVEIRVPSAAQVAATVCGPAAQSGGAGILIGRVRLRGDSSASVVRGARVIAEWYSRTDTTRVRRAEVGTAVDGGFRVCGAPVGTEIMLRAANDSAESSEPVAARIPAGTRVSRVEIVVDRKAQLALAGSTFRGVVVSDSGHRPLAGVEVALPELGKSVQTDLRGAFSISGISAGEHQVLVRRIGFGAADTKLMFDGRQTVERRVVLGRAVSLEAILVSETPTDRRMASFEENRHVGLGHFMTRAEIAKHDGMTLAGLVQQFPAAAIVNGKASDHAWVISKHAPNPCGPLAKPDCLRRNGFYFPEAYEKTQGMIVACYAHVYVDGVLVNGTHNPTDPFDLNQISPQSIEAMEFYAGPAETPMKYSRSGSGCGVLVIWLRRN